MWTWARAGRGQGGGTALHIVTARRGAGHGQDVQAHGNDVVRILFSFRKQI
jgi:hypothetical protein